MNAAMDDLPSYVKRWHAGRWGVSALWVWGVAMNLVGFGGYVLRGFRFLGRFASSPTAVLVIITLIAAAILFFCARPWLSRDRRAAAGTARRTWRGRLAAGLALVTLVVYATLVLGLLRYDFVHAASASEEALRVGVASFGESQEFRSSARGADWAGLVARSLRSKIAELPGLAGNVAVVSLPQVIRSQEEAEVLARKQNLQLVIWGYVTDKELGDILAPSITFVDRAGGELGVRHVPAWYDVTIRGDGSMALEDTLAHHAASFIEYLTGLIYLNRGSYDQAAEEFSRAIALTEEEAKRSFSAGKEIAIKQTLAIFHVALGRTFAAQDRTGDASVEYETATALDPDYGPTYIGIGNLAYSQRHCEEALGFYEQAMKRVRVGGAAHYTSGAGSAIYSRGNAFFCLARYDAAVADYREAIRLAEPGARDLDLYHLALGASLCRLGQADEGTRELELVQSARLKETASAEILGCQPAGGASPEARTPVPTAAISTSEPTVTPTATPSPTSSFTLTAEPSETPEPTVSAAAPAAPSARPPTASATTAVLPTPRRAAATPSKAGGTLRLLVPPEGANAALDQEFSWQWDGPPLGSNEFFDWRLFRAATGEDVVDVRPVKTGRISYPFERLPQGRYFWSVRVVQLDAAQRLIRVVSRESERRPIPWEGLGSRDDWLPPTVWVPGATPQTPAP